MATHSSILACGESSGQRSLMDYSPWDGRKELDTTQWLTHTKMLVIFSSPRLITKYNSDWKLVCEKFTLGIEGQGNSTTNVRAKATALHMPHLGETKWQPKPLFLPGNRMHWAHLYGVHHAPFSANTKAWRRPHKRTALSSCQRVHWSVLLIN